MKKTLLFFLTLFLLAGTLNVSAAKKKKVFTIKTAELISKDQIRIKCGGLSKEFKKIKFKIEPSIKIIDVVRKGSYLDITIEPKMEEDVVYTMNYNDPVTEAKGESGISTTFLVEARFNDMYSDKEMGYAFKNGKSIFRLFVPRGKKVNLVVFEKYDDENGTVYEMKNDGNQVFEKEIDGTLWGKYYGYQIVERKNSPKKFLPKIPDDTIFADPYSKAVATNNVFPQKGRTVIIDTSRYDWGNDKPLDYDIDDYIVMEMHVRDLTAHETAGTPNPGTFKGMVNAKTGGINYLRKLGVNAIEFMPIHDFGNIEAPYKESSHGFKNTWNVYSQNYWGYMTFNFFAPESYYATDGTLDPKKWNGTDGRVVSELKDTIKELHKNGIAVILDVVYNHVSQYDENALKIIDWDYYFKKKSGTGCGQEIETRRKMARRLVIDSLKYWMKEYHVDGFRFDLAASHDNETVKQIYTEVRKINPKVFLAAEPWGGEGATTASQFIDMGWAKWNDGSRGAIRGGENRPTGKGKAFMLGNSNRASALVPYWQAPRKGTASQYVDYIESHDDATLGDIIRILSGEYVQMKNGKPNRITDLDKHIQLSKNNLNAAKVAAASLFMCQGPIMMHLGQEWARSKVTPEGDFEELSKGPLGSSSDTVLYNTASPNSYSADNDTNYINYDKIKLNQDLFDYYQGFLKLRKSQPLLGQAKKDQIEIYQIENKNALGANIDNKIFGFVNSDPENTAIFDIPTGDYDVVVDKNKAGTDVIKTIKGGKVTVPTASALILIKK